MSYAFPQIPPHDGHLLLCDPLSKLVRDLHPLANAHAERTQKKNLNRIKLQLRPFLMS